MLHPMAPCPTLFNIFINDIPNIFDDNCNPARVGNMKINCMMYADDLIVISESHKGLQESMNKLEKYCEQWGITVNVSKTKYMISNSKYLANQKYELHFNDVIIDQVKSTKYLGIEFSYDGKMQIAKSDLYKRGLKAYFKLMRSLKPYPTPKISINLFDHLVKPIILYGCEIWSPFNLDYKLMKQPLNKKATFIHDIRVQMPFITKYMETINDIEKLHLKFCKTVLGVHSKTSNLAVYSELGRYPLIIDQMISCLKYLDYIENDSKNEFLKEFVNNLMLDDKMRNNCTLFKFRQQIGKFLNIRLNIYSKGQWKIIRTSLNSHFDRYWNTMVFNDTYDNNKKGGNKLRTYRIIKTNIAYESYLNMRKFEKRKYITQFRVSAHKLKIETGRYNSNNAYINPEDRLCMQCSLNTKEDEFHFLLECEKYKCIRKELFLKCQNDNELFNSYNNQCKFIWLLTTENLKTQNHLGDYFINAFNMRKE